MLDSFLSSAIIIQNIDMYDACIEFSFFFELYKIIHYNEFKWIRTRLCCTYAREHIFSCNQIGHEDIKLILCGQYISSCLFFSSLKNQFEILEQNMIIYDLNQLERERARNFYELRNSNIYIYINFFLKKKLNFFREKKERKKKDCLRIGNKRDCLFFLVNGWDLSRNLPPCFVKLEVVKYSFS